LRAAGLRGGENADPRAAKWFSEEYQKHQDEARSRKISAPRGASVSGFIQPARGDEGEGGAL
jgi:hypothetical protein